MKFSAFIFAVVVIGFAAAQSESPVYEHAHLERSNRTGKFLDLPDPVMNLFRPALMNKISTYGNKAMHWLQTVDLSAVGVPLIFTGFIGLLMTALVTIFVGVFGLDKGASLKYKPYAVPVDQQPIRRARVLNEQVDDVTTKVYEAIDKFLEQKS